MSNKPKYPVYLSQLKQFKESAKQFADLISDESETSPISAFKRNDWLSQTLGHKGHSDLTFFAKSCRDSDTSEELYLFCDDDQLQTAIIDIFSSKLPDVPREVIESAAFQMKMGEYFRMLNTPHTEEESEALSKLGGYSMDDTYYG
ncbi:hypothetical protein ACEV7Z_06880 [Vibrio parahaemolyticus]|uniref:hypothetical protein n=1 Tax=Vibrio parahaemolyticus TaxID=670 RepID=UPI002490E35A|nr:hypothetical protein [Vibrio parahaemolyticus]EHK7585772.1 hypothetical protein [Vibrio parahaemolyticus]